MVVSLASSCYRTRVRTRSRWMCQAGLRQAARLIVGTGLYTIVNTDNNCVSTNRARLERMVKEWGILRDAIRSAPVPFAVFDLEDRLLAWNLFYEMMHAKAFATNGGNIESGQLSYRDLMRFQVDPTLRANDAEAELDRLMSLSSRGGVREEIQESSDFGHFKFYWYRLDNGARAGIGVDVNDLIDTRTELATEQARIEDLLQKSSEGDPLIGQIASTDELTELPNRQSLASAVSALRARFEKDCSTCVVLSIDLDRFSDINETSGYAAGDHVLRETAQRLKSLCRSDDLVHRMGSDEFAIVMVGQYNMAAGKSLAEKFVETISQPISFNSENCTVTASIGVSEQSLDDVELDEILIESVRAMRRAKSQGGNRVELCGSAPCDGLSATGSG